MGLPPIWFNAAKQSEEVIMLKFAALALVAAVTVGVASESMAKGGNGGGGNGGSGPRMHSGGNYGGGGMVPSSNGGNMASARSVSFSPISSSGRPQIVDHRGTTSGRPQVVDHRGGMPPVVGPIGPIGPKHPQGPVVTWPGGGIPPVVGPGGGGPKPVPPMQPPHHGHWHGGRNVAGGYQPAALYVPGNQECFQEQRRINGIVKLVKVCHEPN
jgi:hypothetical protein